MNDIIILFIAGAGGAILARILSPQNVDSCILALLIFLVLKIK